MSSENQDQKVEEAQNYLLTLNKPFDKTVWDIDTAPIIKGYDMQSDYVEHQNKKDQNQKEEKQNNNNNSVPERVINLEKLLESYTNVGFQATNFGKAVEEIKKMITWRPDPKNPAEAELEPGTRCKIFLGYTSNMVSCGVREIIRFLVQNRMVDVIVSSAGGVEEDFIKCLAPTYLGSFELPGRDLRLSGLNRIGNMVVPNQNYVKFEDWIMDVFDEMLEEQNKQNINWTPSKMIHRLGKAINNEDSVYYWCYKNNIPVYCPAITDGSLGDMLYFHAYKSPGLKLDLVEDIKGMNNEAIWAKKSGMIIVGGGVIKHHICNANLFRNGADFSVFINTGQEFDGSDSGARPDEAKSWGKIKIDATPVKLYSEATLVFPLLVAQTFAKYWTPKTEPVEQREY